MTKTDFIQSIRQLVGEGKTEEALDLFKQCIGDIDPALKNDALLLASGFESAKTEFFVKNLMLREEFDSIVGRIKYALLETIDKLEKETPLSINRNSGRLLHHIPSRMPMTRESRCIVRIAYDDANLTRNFKVDTNTTIEDVKIAKVMDVELVDFNEIPAFQIRTMSEAEQLIVSDDFTQWIFMVKPLREGTYPLMLKVAVLENVDGKERRREIVLEKEIIITNQEETPQYAAQKSAFADSNIQFNYAVTSDSAVGTATQQGSKRFSMSSVMSGLAVVVLAFTSVLFYRQVTNPVSPDVAENPNTGLKGNNDKPNGTNGDNGADTLNLNQTPNQTPLMPQEMANFEKKTENPQAVPLPPNSPNTQKGSGNLTDNGSKKGRDKLDAKTTRPTRKNEPRVDANKAAPPPKIILDNVVKLDPSGKPMQKLEVEKETEDGALTTYRVRIKLKGKMKSATILVDNQPVSVVKSRFGVPTMVEFKSRKTTHSITFSVDGLSCTVPNVVITGNDLELESCSF